MDLKTPTDTGRNTITSASLCKHTLNASKLGILVVDNELRIQFFNTWFSEMSDMPAKLAINFPLDQVFPEIKGSRLIHALKQALKHDVSSTLSQSILTSQFPLFANDADRNAKRYLLQSIHITPLRVNDTERYCSIQITDVTDTVRREQYLEHQNRTMAKLSDETIRAKAQFEAIFRYAPDGLITLSKDTKIELFNPVAEKLLGYESAEVIGQPLSMLAPQQHHEQYKALFSRLRNTDNSSIQNRHQEVIGRHKSGRQISFEIKVSTADFDDQTFTVVSISDISQRKALEAQIYREKELAHTILESISDAVVTTDRDGLLTYVNPIAQSMSGYRETDVLGQPFSTFFTVTSTEGEQDLHAVITRSLHATHEDTVPGVYIFLTRHHKSYTIQTHVSSMHDSNGQGVGSVIVFRDVTKEIKLKNKLTYNASHDELTGLINRREFERQLDLSIESSINQGLEHCLCFMDLDRFKIVNDTCGHVAGDELLRQLTAKLQHKVRAADEFARVGGDEFALLLRHCDETHAIKIAEGVREAVEEFRFSWDNKQFTVSASIGLVPIRHGVMDLAETLSAADNACYEAKRNGRNRVCVFEQDHTAFTRHSGDVHWANRITAAIEKNQLTLFAQPIAPLQNGASQGMYCEILVRMKDDDGSIIAPMAFIPAAERFNMMSSIDQWVFQSTLDFLVQNPSFNRKVSCIAINLSGQSLSDDAFLDRVIKKLQVTPIPPQIICFEVTETAAISNLAKVKHFMERVKEMGCQFSLDDFGSGLSSFGYLKNLPVDTLKIDGVFVKDMLNDPIDCAMVEAINNIGQVMGLKTIAEFVENEDIRDKLKSVGVDYAQGYGVCRPLPLKDLASQFLENEEPSLGR